MNFHRELAAEFAQLGIVGQRDPSEKGWIVNTLALCTVPSWKEVRGSDGLICVSRTHPPVEQHFTSVMIEGDFGILWEVVKISANGKETLFCKTEPKKGKLTVEALTQVCAGVVLRKQGFPWAVPPVRDIGRHPRWGTVFTMVPIRNAKLLSHFLTDSLQWNLRSPQNDRLVLSILVQVAIQLAILERELGLNHRDLKESNVMMISLSEEKIMNVVLGERTQRFTTGLRTILIDFGFACMGDLTTRISKVSAGNQLSAMDFCPKEGRDLFLLLTSLIAEKRFRDCLTIDCLRQIRRWVGAKRQDWICKTKDLNEILENLLLVSLRNEFHNASSDPLVILSDIAAQAPGILVISGGGVGGAVGSTVGNEGGGGGGGGGGGSAASPEKN